MGHGEHRSKKKRKDQASGSKGKTSVAMSEIASSEVPVYWERRKVGHFQTFARDSVFHFHGHMRDTPWKAGKDKKKDRPLSCTPRGGSSRATGSTLVSLRCWKLPWVRKTNSQMGLETPFKN